VDMSESQESQRQVEYIRVEGCFRLNVDGYSKKGRMCPNI
jgi:hypothetical protein